AAHIQNRVRPQLPREHFSVAAAMVPDQSSLPDIVGVSGPSAFEIAVSVMRLHMGFRRNGADTAKAMTANSAIHQVVAGFEKNPNRKAFAKRTENGRFRPLGIRVGGIQGKARFHGLGIPIADYGSAA